MNKHPSIVIIAASSENYAALTMRWYSLDHNEQIFNYLKHMNEK